MQHNASLDDSMTEAEKMNLKVIQAHREGSDKCVVSVPELWEDLVELLCDTLEVKEILLIRGLNIDRLTSPSIIQLPYPDEFH